VRLNWRGVLGIVLSVAFLWWALHGIDWGQVAHHLRAADPWLLLVAVVLATLAIAVRAPRWRIILAPIDRNISLGALWRSTAIGIAINNSVPARVGELARAYALTREAPAVPFSTAFASLAVDRVFDAVAVMLLTLLALLDPAFPKQAAGVSQRVAHTLGLGTVFAVVAMVLLYLLVFLPERVIRLYEWFARRLAPRLEARGRDALLAFAAGLGVLRSPRRFAAVFAWTLATWLLNGAAFWAGFKAFGIGVSFGAALFVQGVIVIGIAIPQAPGFFGVFEAAARWTLGEVYGVSSSLAVSWAIGYHVLTFIPITLIGLWYFVRLGLHLRELEAPQRGAPGEPPDEARDTDLLPVGEGGGRESGGVSPRRR
jgi:uncharacterized protein (TIRG00374 family)